MNKKNFVILGAGISGLTTAYLLQKKGYSVTVFEARGDPGGTMISEFHNRFLIDYGPNSTLETTPLIREIVHDIGLDNELVYASNIAKKRYILRNGKLHPLPMNPFALLSTNLFSLRAKLRLLKEPFIKKSNMNEESIADFVRRRLGNEFLDYAINPFVSGVYAGDPEKLSVKFAFPKLFELEERYGSLIQGAIKGKKERQKRNETSKSHARMFSFMNGMQSFPRAIAKKLGNSVEYNTAVTSLQKENNEYRIFYTKGEGTNSLHADIVISTVPAYVASKIFESFDRDLSLHLNKIYYPPVMTLFLGFNRKDIRHDLDGFGFLIPEKEHKTFLGAIWNSAIFPNRASEDKASFTLFIGGARMPHVFEMEKTKLIEIVISEFKEIMNIPADPILIQNKLWKQAIPQYNIGYHEHEEYFQKFEKNNPGLFLSGNYRGGISIGDCIKNAHVVSSKI